MIPVEEVPVGPKSPDNSIPHRQCDELSIHRAPARAVSVVRVLLSAVPEDDLVLGVEAPDPRRSSTDLAQRARDTLPAGPCGRLLLGALPPPDPVRDVHSPDVALPTDGEALVLPVNSGPVLTARALGADLDRERVEASQLSLQDRYHLSATFHIIVSLTLSDPLNKIILTTLP